MNYLNQYFFQFIIIKLIIIIKVKLIYFFLQFLFEVIQISIISLISNMNFLILLYLNILFFKKDFNDHLIKQYLFAFLQFIYITLIFHYLLQSTFHVILIILSLISYFHLLNYVICLLLILFNLSFIHFHLLFLNFMTDIKIIYILILHYVQLPILDINL